VGSGSGSGSGDGTGSTVPGGGAAYDPCKDVVGAIVVDLNSISNPNAACNDEGCADQYIIPVYGCGIQEKPETPAIPGTNVNETTITCDSYDTEEIDCTGSDVNNCTCTCREDAPCKASGCYCMKGRQAMCNVVAAYVRNLMIYNNDHDDFWEQVKFKIKHNPLPLFRWFDAGDILDYEFFCGMVELAKEFPNIRFMSFTKKYDIVNEWLTTNGDLPKNLNIIFC
jgi:hypothetical protein